MKRLTPTRNGIEGRRRFLRSIPAAVIAGCSLADLSPSLASAQHPIPPITKETSLRIGAEQLILDGKALSAVPGKEGVNKVLYYDNDFKIALWNEKAISAEEFEWHELTDHILTVLEGSTSYEVGGTPQSPHSPSPTQWKAPSSPGATKMTLNKGDIFVVRRGTPHRRITKDSVIFTLVSPATNA